MGVTGEQIQRCWDKPIPAIKKLDWHEKWRNGMPVIKVIITGFRVFPNSNIFRGSEGTNLKIYFSYFDPKTGAIVHSIDISNQFKIKKS